MELTEAGTALVLGGASWNQMVYLDRFPDPEPQTVFARRHHETLGSSGAGKAANLAWLGWDTTLWAALGDDDAGAQVRAAAEDHGITVVTTPDPAGTMRHVNLMDAAGDRISIFAEAGTFELDVDHVSMVGAMTAADLVAVTIFQHCRGFLPIAGELGVPLWIDVHDYDGVDPYHEEFIEAAAFLQLSSTKLTSWRAFAEHRIESGAHLVVCTHGAEGASAVTDAGWVEVPARPVAELVDTNGAGDGFFAGFATSWLATGDLAAALDAGAEIAAQVLASPELAPVISR